MYLKFQIHEFYYAISIVMLIESYIKKMIQKKSLD